MAFLSEGSTRETGRLYRPACCTRRKLGAGQKSSQTRCMALRADAWKLKAQGNGSVKVPLKIHRQTQITRARLRFAAHGATCIEELVLKRIWNFDRGKGSRGSGKMKRKTANFLLEQDGLCRRQTNLAKIPSWRRGCKYAVSCHKERHTGGRDCCI